MNVFLHQIVDIVAIAMQQILRSFCLDNNLSETGLKPELDIMYMKSCTKTGSNAEAIEKKKEYKKWA